ncbi:MAG: carbohydrate-binding domain-containing protein [Ruminococcus sp.]|nr:carbohydrate-binding domain-containing protein [Ruminococcus sp.]
MNNFINRIMMTAITFAVMAVGCTDNSDSDSGTTTSEKMTTISAGTDETTEPAEENNTDDFQTTIVTQIIEETTVKSIPVQSMIDRKTSGNEIFSDRDLNPDYSAPNTVINLTGNGATVDGAGVTVDGSKITVTGEGIYIIRGTLDDGQIIVDADGAKVQLVLDNVNINCSNSSAIYAVNAKKVFVTLADGTENVLTDGMGYVFTDTEKSEPDSVIFSHDSLTINGTGGLEINGNFNDGIRSKDDVVITGGKITVNAVGNGIKGKDYVAIADGEINITAGFDGIKSTNTDDISLGFVYFEGGTLNITADGDGIQAETVFSATDGVFNITSGGGSSASTKTHNDDFGGFGKGGGFGRGGGFGMGEKPDMPEDFNPEDFERPDFRNFNPADMEVPENPETLAFSPEDNNEDTSDTVSTKGIKASAEISILGGTFSINSADDAIHSNADVTIENGNIILETGNKGIHSDTTATINSGWVNIKESYEGIEADVITVNGGTVEVVSSDDGFNASDGETNQSGMGTYTDTTMINITGGIVYVNAGGDGLDSNGDINITGGTVIVDGPENSGNGALDSNGEIIVSGGTLVAVGMSGMAESPSEKSTQNSVSATFDSTFDGGTLVTLLDDSGNEILSYQPAKSFDNIVISSPDIKTGTTYTFYIGGTSFNGDSGHGLYDTGGYNNDGTEAGSFTAESNVSYVGRQSGMGGGFGGGGGMHMHGERPDDMPEPPDMNGGHGFKQPRQ